jgi:formyltetrahydrofolate hydrolase|tara:strand:+ start:1336 stop:1473 length:138 start_codon:yes stop_codon:yes gene_type:complete
LHHFNDELDDGDIIPQAIAKMCQRMQLYELRREYLLVGKGILSEK